MNYIKSTCAYFSIVFLFLLPVLSFAQGYENHCLVSGETYEQYFYSTITPNSTNNPAPANHGTTEIAYHTVNNGRLQFVFRYTPDEGFTGIDSTSFIYFEGFNTPIYVYLRFEVVSSKVDAEDDYTVIETNSSVNIDVLANDLSSTGEMTISAIPMVSNGSVEILEDQTLQFTPDIGFKGVARFHYTVCNEDENCDVALASVFVDEGFNTIDTTEVFAKKETKVNVLVPTQEGYIVQQSPSHGTLHPSEPEGILEYIPRDGFVGEDNFSIIYFFNRSPVFKPFHVKVLNAKKPNALIKPDLVHMGINGVGYFNVLDNDLGSNLYVQRTTDPQYGTFTRELGQFTYHPPEDFEGVDEFSYTACVLNTGVCETATVSLVISDQEPNSIDYDFHTTKDSPLVIRYETPTKNWRYQLSPDDDSWSSLNTSNGGLIVNKPGRYEGWVGGQEVSGTNLLIYYPPANQTLEESEELYFCTDAGCQLLRLNIYVEEPIEGVEAGCLQDCVFAGDLNNDGQVNMIDLLPLGYAIGERGPLRENAVLDWFPQFAEDWGVEDPSGVDLKHIDANGDGIISIEDSTALAAAYGKTHQIISKVAPRVSNQPLIFTPRNAHPGPGDLVLIDFELGSENNPIIDANGLTFRLSYNSAIVEPGSMQVHFDSDSWLTYDAPVISQTVQAFNNKLDVGLTRTDARTAHGFGKIGTVSFIIIDNIDGFRPGDEMELNTDVSNSVAMNAEGELIGLTTYDPTLFIQFSEENNTEEQLLFAYPNPSSGLINLHLNGEEMIEDVSVFSSMGQLVMQQSNVNSDRLELDFSSAYFSTGMYIVKATTTDGYQSAKIRIVK